MRIYNKHGKTDGGGGMLKRYLFGVGLIVVLTLLCLSAAVAAVLASREAETMTLGPNVTLNSSGTAVRFDDSGEWVEWVNGGVNNGDTVVAEASGISGNSTRVGLELLVNGVSTGPFKFIAPGNNTATELSWSGLDLSDSDELRFRAKEVAPGERILVNRARVEGTVSTTDTTPPNTTMGSVTQSDVAGRDVQISFSGTDNVTPPGSLTFECSLDGGAYEACTSPQSYLDLSSGTHTFSVRAKDAAGNVDATPALTSFVVKNIIDITSSPYLATGNDTTNDANAINSAMADAGPNTVVYIPDGTFYFNSIYPPSDTEIAVQGTTVIKRYGSSGPLFTLQGVADTDFAQNIDIYGVGGRPLIDVSTENTNSSGFRVRSVKNFSIKNFDIHANNSNPASEPPTTLRPGVSFLPVGQTKIGTEWQHAHNGLIENVHGSGYGKGWGITQLTGAEDVHFENISSEGGIALRLENFEGSATTIDDVTADGVTCLNGSAAVSMQPHNADDGNVQVENVTANSCGDGISVFDDDVFPSGNFDPSTINNVDVNPGSTAQVRDFSEPSTGAWLVRDSEWCVDTERDLNYPMPTITNIDCGGLPSNNWP
jgi:hypothetical protein